MEERELNRATQAGDSRTLDAGGLGFFDCDGPVREQAKPHDDIRRVVRRQALALDLRPDPVAVGAPFAVGVAGVLEDFVLQLARGRPAAAVDVAEKLRVAQRDESGFPRMESSNALVLAALYGDGDASAAAAALASLTDAAFRPDGSPYLDAPVPDLCTVAQSRLWKGEDRGVEAAAARLRAADRMGGFKDTGLVCAMPLEAIESTLDDGSDADRRLARLDSALATGPEVHFTTLKVPANIAAARLYEGRGDFTRALAAVRRRVHDLDSTGLLVATTLRMEGRLAAAVGDTAGAIRAYRHYLALRSDPEPALRAQADSVRSALAELVDAGGERGSQPDGS